MQKTSIRSLLLLSLAFIFMITLAMTNELSAQVEQRPVKVQFKLKDLPSYQKDRGQGFFFSTEEDFLTQGPEPADGNPIISDGDLLHTNGYIYMRNGELLKNFNCPYDLGLDAAHVIDDSLRLVVFSTELDHPRGLFTEGDLLCTNGIVIPNAVLLARFQVPQEQDLGLDAVHLQGDRKAIIDFLLEIKREYKSQLKKPEEFVKLLETYRIDVWFSTEGTPPPLSRPIFLDGDLLSAAAGTIVLSNRDALPVTVPAGIPDRGVDFGMDAFSTIHDPIEQLMLEVFSTEILGEKPAFTDGDVILKGDGVLYTNNDLIKAFEPKTDFLGLDALSIEDVKPITSCQFLRVGGVDVNSSTWDYTTGYVDPDLSGDKNHPFGSWVSVRGVFPSDATHYRISVRPDGAANSTPILMPASYNWRVRDHRFIWTWISVVIDGKGWMSTSFWNFLKDTCLNGDLILVDWNSAAKKPDGTRVYPDGKYILNFEIKYATGDSVICSELPIQIDNKRPDVELDNNNECKEYGPADMPITIRGKIFDLHFSHCNLTIDTIWMAPHSLLIAYYNSGAPFNDQGTVSYPAFDNLYSLNIPVELGAQAKGGRYTVLLHVRDRSILGGFTATSNWVKDGDGIHGNYNYHLTNFEFYP